MLLGGEPIDGPTRLVSLRLSDGRPVALAASEVHGLVDSDELALAEMPPLLGEAGASTVEQIGRLHGALLSVLEVGRVLAPEAFPLGVS